MGEQRPTYHDPRVIDAVARDLLPEVTRWSKGDSSESEIMRDLTKALRYGRDGYALARELERMHWDPDFELVEILEGANFYSVHRNFVCEWVRANNVTPPFPLGHVVKTAHGIGPIVAIDDEQATYTVRIEGAEGKGVGYFGHIYPFEAVTDAAPK